MALRLTVVAHPGSRREAVELLEPSTLAVWVRAKPVDGQANAAIERALATALHLHRRAVKIVVGGASRRKIVEVDLPSLNEVHDRLLAYGLRRHQTQVNAEQAHGDS